MTEALLVGWGEANITPESKKVELCGQYYQRVSREVHSPLKTVALALSQGDAAAVMVSIDTVGVPPEYGDRLRRTLAQRVPECPSHNVVFNATHTHCAPALKVSRGWWEPDPDAIKVEEYQDLLESRVVEAVSAAWANRQSRGVGLALGSARVGHCRRVVYTDGTAEMYGRTDRPDFAGLEGDEDSGVDLLFFFDDKRKPSGVIVNVACPSQIMESTYSVSSDFMGALREKLKAEYGDEFHALCQISAAGCQSPRDLSRNYKGEPDFWNAAGVEVISNRLLGAVRSSVERAAGEIEATPRLAVSSTELSLPKRRASYPDYIAARRELELLEVEQSSEDAYAEFCDVVHRNEKIPGRPGPYDDKLMRFVLQRNAEAVIRRYEEQNAEPDFEMRLGAVRIGDAAFVTNPFELFLEYGQRIKARSPAGQTFVVQLADGVGGYLPTPRAEALGGYGGLIINGQVGSDGGALLVDRSLEVIEGLWD